MTSCFRLHIAYVGTDFCGFVAQKDGLRTVESELSLALSCFFKGPFKITVAGRTDAGVHARGQVVSVEGETSLSLRQLTLALFTKIPKDISVWRIDEMPLGFNARRHAVGKRYIYRIYEGLISDPFTIKTALHVRPTLDIEMMNQAANYFLGEHDFSSFRSSACTAAHARRYLWGVHVTRKGSFIEIDVRGNAFCMNMVRIMAGTLIEVGQKRRTAASIAEALAKKDRTLAGITAKPHGLTLEQIYYPDDLLSANIPLQAQFPRYPLGEEELRFLAKDIAYGPC